jgi:Helicase conserved C-terminal domain
VLYARRNLEEPVPHFDTLEQWEEKKSTKVDTCARLCRHLLTRDDAPEIVVVDGEVHFPPFPSLQPAESPQTTNKLIISMELTCLGPLLRNVSPHFNHSFALSLTALQVLDLYGIKNVYINGQLSYQQRAKVIAQFLLHPDCRVLIISSVGSIGLNLTNACIVIYVVRLLVLLHSFSLSISLPRPRNGVPKTNCKFVAASIARRKKRLCAVIIY